MSINRARRRNIHMYNGLTRELLGVLKQNGSLTEAVFLFMLNGILVIAGAPLEVKQRDSERIILYQQVMPWSLVHMIYCNGECSWPQP